MKINNLSIEEVRQIMSENNMTLDELICHLDNYCATTTFENKKREANYWVIKLQTYRIINKHCH